MEKSSRRAGGAVDLPFQRRTGGPSLKLCMRTPISWPATLLMHVTQRNCHMGEHVQDVPCGVASSDEELEAWDGGGHLCRNSVSHTMECEIHRSHALEAGRGVWTAPNTMLREQSEKLSKMCNHLCKVKTQVDKKIHTVHEYSLKAHIRMLAYRGGKKQELKREWKRMNGGPCDE